MSFDDFASAQRFCGLVNKFGPDNALEALGAEVTTGSAMTVGQWLERYIDHLTGVAADTVDKYRSYLRRDIGPALGDLPLTALTRHHVAAWLNSMREPDANGKVASAKTVKNKHGFLSGALNAAVPKYIPSNPCAGMRLPRDDEAHEMLFLSREQFTLLLGNVTEPWRPLVEFLVASGCRWGEAVGLKPADVDIAAGTVRIRRAWKYSKRKGYYIGPPKTPKSRRTINVPDATLAKLDYSHEWLFVNRSGGPVRAQGFYHRVWDPARERTWPSVDADGNAIDLALVLRPRVHDLRHTCASWLIQAGVPLPVIQGHLGHESITTTIDRYGHLDRRSMLAAAIAIGEVLALPA